MSSTEVSDENWNLKLNMFRSDSTPKSRKRLRDMNFPFFRDVLLPAGPMDFNKLMKSCKKGKYTNKVATFHDCLTCGKKKFETRLSELNKWKKKSDVVMGQFYNVCGDCKRSYNPKILHPKPPKKEVKTVRLLVEDIVPHKYIPFGRDPVRITFELLGGTIKLNKTTNKYECLVAPHLVEPPVFNMLLNKPKIWHVIRYVGMYSVKPTVHPTNTIKVDFLNKGARKYGICLSGYLFASRITKEYNDAKKNAKQAKDMETKLIQALMKYGKLLHNRDPVSRFASVNECVCQYVYINASLQQINAILNHE